MWISQQQWNDHEARLRALEARVVQGEQHIVVKKCPELPAHDIRDWYQLSVVEAVKILAAHAGVEFKYVPGQPERCIAEEK